MPRARSARSGPAIPRASIGEFLTRRRRRGRSRGPLSSGPLRRFRHGSKPSSPGNALVERPSLAQRLAAEGVGAFFLFATVIGSGIMAENLAGGNDAVALLANTIATGAILFVLITMLGPVSGAHIKTAGGAGWELAGAGGGGGWV